MKWAMVDIEWDGAPPVRRLLGVIQRCLDGFERDYLRNENDTRAFDPHTDLTEKGARLHWYKHGERCHELARILGEHHPVKLRWQLYGDRDGEQSEDEALAKLPTTPWTYSRSLGTPDIFGRINR
jgi:hypothetical protein